MGLDDEVDACMLQLVCKVVKLGHRQCQPKVRDWHRIPINIIMACGCIVAFDLVADNLMAEEAEVYPALGRPALCAVELPAAQSLSQIASGGHKEL